MRWIYFALLYCIACPVLALEAPPDVQFDVARYEITGANPLSAEEISKILKPYLGRHYGLEGLSSAVTELERKFKEQGYSFHRVILEPQSLKQGIVRLRIYEFKLGKLNVSGNKFFTDDNIKNSLPALEQGRAPNTRNLNLNLSVANDHPDKTLQMVFKEGEKQNTIDVDLNVLDKSPHTSYAKLTNTGTEASGEWRLGVGYQYSNLFNKDHITSINYSTSTEQPENVAQWVLSYSLPLYASGDLISIYYSDSVIESTSSVQGLPGNFDISGSGTVFGTRYMQGFKKQKGYKHKLIYGLDSKRFNNQILFAGNIVSGTNELQSFPLSVEYEFSRPKSRTPFSLSVSYYVNLIDDQDAYDLEPRNPDTKWKLIRYRAKYDLPVTSWMLSLRLEGQYADEPLISGEQFGVGGSQSVRAYEERAILGDRGNAINIEFWKATKNKRTKWLFFYDAAETVFNEDIGTGIIKQAPTSFGFGIRWQWGRYLSVAADVAEALEDAGETKSGDNKVHFNMTYQY